MKIHIKRFYNKQNLKVNKEILKVDRSTRFPEKAVQINNTQMKRCLVSLISKEIQNRTPTIVSPVTLVRAKKINA